MKAKEIREKNPEELKNILQDKKVELCQLRFEVKANQIQNHQQLKSVRRDIARIETILGESKEK
ncbi:MAG: 50S ribosomal protein L29 [Patescibacteria group bacterium]|jgi:large subunit ribosomal protein L29|nr:50S ribosomal protein L29 [Patescibacteria group bacterium]